MKSSGRKWYSRMSPRELEEIATKYDREIDVSELKPLTPAMRAEETRSKRKKRGRPRVGRGAKRVIVSMEKGLLEQLDAHTRRHKLTRAAFVAQAVREHLARCA